MAANEITWVATLVAPGSLAELRELATSFEWEVLVDGPHQLMCRDGQGVVIEYCTEKHPVPGYLFENQTVVVGIMVDDLDGMLERIAATGVEAVGIRTIAGAVEFQHVRRRDGTVFGLIAESR